MAFAISATNANFYPQFIRESCDFKLFFSTSVFCNIRSVIRSIAFSIADHSYSQNVLRNAIVAPKPASSSIKMAGFYGEKFILDALKYTQTIILVLYMHSVAILLNFPLFDFTLNFMRYTS